MTMGPTVLFVSPGPSLVTPVSGEGARLKHLSRELAKEWDVLALVPTRVGEECPVWVHRQYTYDQWSMPFLTDLNPSFVRALAQVLRRETIDVVHLSHGLCTARALSTVLRTGTTVVYAAQNVEAEHAREFIDPELPAYKRLLGPWLIPAIERVSVRFADYITTVSEADRKRFREKYGIDGTRIRAIPTGTSPVETAELEPPAAIRERYGLDTDAVAVFHGFYGHPPNEEAVNLIVEKIGPRTLERDVDVEFLLVGKGMPAVDAPNVTAVGFVEDLFSTLNAADFAVVPILHGGGTKTKVYDYLSLGLPFISTSKGVEGIDVEDGIHAVVTDGVDEAFVNAVEQLATDDDLRSELRKNIGKLARERTWDRSGDELSSFYRSLG